MANDLSPEFKFTFMEIGHGRIEPRGAEGSHFQLVRPPTHDYSNAQIDDYSGRKRKEYEWSPPLTLSLDARFSHPAQQLNGTAGFGFWNAPFGDPNMPYPALPKAIWFFFGSAPNDLPVNPAGKGQGWFANTLDATTWAALGLVPFALPTILLNHWPWFRQHIWPRIQRLLQISYLDLNDINITEWHRYELEWYKEYCIFRIDGRTVLETETSAQGPLGFVCWIDNQYMCVTPTGRMGAGTIPTTKTQWLEVKNIAISKLV